MDAIWRNLRYASRRLGQRPGFTLVAVASLALGIGANTAIFTLVNAVLLQQSPIEDPHELYEVYLSTPEFEYGVFSYPDYRDFVEGTREVFSEVSATRLVLVQADRGDGIQMLPGEAVTGNYFTLLGLEAALGRTLLPEDDVAPGAHDVVMLGYRYWQSELGGDPGVLGETLRLGGRPYTIVGVAPESYEGRFRGLVASVFAPRMMVNELMPGSVDELEERRNHSVMVRARLRPGVSLVEAQAAADAVVARLLEADTEAWDPQSSFLLFPSRDVILFPNLDTFIRFAAWFLMAVVGLVLLMACVNLASFLMARALDRKKEIALRLALGASRKNLVAQLLTETTFLSLLGGLAGVGVSIGLLKLLTGADLPLPIPITLDLEPDGTVLGFSLGVSLFAGVVLGLVPAVQGTSPDLSATIKDESAGVGRSGTFTLRNALVIVQVATSLVLLVGAGLLLRSLANVHDIDPGFGREPAAILKFAVPAARYTEEEGREFVRRLVERTLEIPGVDAAGVISDLQLDTLNNQTMAINVDGVEPPPGRDTHTVDRATVSLGFFESAGIAILRGRNFTDDDDADAPPVAIVSVAMAEKFWPGEDPLGRRIRRPGDDDDDLLVVGIAKDTKVRSLGEAPRAFVYLPYRQAYTSFLTLVAKTKVASDEAPLALVAAARELDPDLWIWEAKTMARHLGIVLLPARLLALVVSAFAALALALASIGLYGIVSYAVSQRTREVGIRVSLGADGARVIRMLMASGLKLVALGSAIGLTLALLAAPALRSVLVGVGAVDVVTFTVMPLALVLVAALAAYVPARRASRIDPVRALRSE